MKIIISPAKKMKDDWDSLPWRDLPGFFDKAEVLRDYLRSLSYKELKKLLACNDQIAELNFRRFQTMDLRRGLTPALLAYEGIQYRYMSPGVFTAGQYEYVQAHLRILSGFYGLLRPFDGVTPYRLEMQARLKTGFCDSLYGYWGPALAEALLAEGEDTVLNLASEEYARAVRPYVPGHVRFITPVFGELSGGRVVEKGVYVKMARGEMVRFLSERQAQGPEAVLEFRGLGYRCDPERSGRDMPVFLKEGKPNG